MVKALDLSSNGRMSAWVRTPPVLKTFCLLSSYELVKGNRHILFVLSPTGIIPFSYRGSFLASLVSVVVCFTLEWRRVGPVKG